MAQGTERPGLRNADVCRGLLWQDSPDTATRRTESNYSLTGACPFPKGRIQGRLISRAVSCARAPSHRRSALNAGKTGVPGRRQKNQCKSTPQPPTRDVSAVQLDLLSALTEFSQRPRAPRLEAVQGIGFFTLHPTRSMTSRNSTPQSPPITFLSQTHHWPMAHSMPSTALA